MLNCGKRTRFRPQAATCFFLRPFGYAVLNGDMQNSEWGYFTLSELKAISIYGLEIDHDLHWKPTQASEIERIKDWL